MEDTGKGRNSNYPPVPYPECSSEEIYWNNKQPQNETEQHGTKWNNGEQNKAEGI